MLVGAHPCLIYRGEVKNMDRLRAYSVLLPLTVLLAATFDVYVMLARASPARGEDFKTFLAAASLLGHHNPYDLTALLQRQQQLFGTKVSANNWAAKNPFVAGPSLLLLLHPLTTLPWRMAFVLWDGVLLLGIGAAIAQGSRAGTRPWLFPLVALASPVVFINLLLGQVDGVLLLALATAFALQDRHHFIASGALLSLGLIKPQIMAGAVFLLAFRAIDARALRRYSAGFLSASGITVLLALRFGGENLLSQWLRALLGFGANVAPVQVNISSLSVFYIAPAPHALTLLTLLGAGVWSTGVIVAWLRNGRSSGARWFALGMTSWLLVTPYAHPHDDVALLPALGVLLALYGATRAPALRLSPRPLLGHIEPDRVRVELRDRLRSYKRWVRKVVYETFARETGIETALPGAQSVVPAMPDVAALIHIAQMAEAIATMARQQAAFEQQVDTRFLALQTEIVEHHDAVMGRLDQAAAVVGSLMHRMTAVEGVVAPGGVVSEAQAAEISTLVKAIATEMAAKEPGTASKGAIPTSPCSANSTVASACPVITLSRWPNRAT